MVGKDLADSGRVVVDRYFVDGNLVLGGDVAGGDVVNVLNVLARPVEND